MELETELYVVDSQGIHGKKRKAVELECEYCRNKYLHRADRKERSLFCSKECKLEYNKDYINFQCHNCGEFFQRSRSKAQRSKHGYYFCSRECKDKSQSLEGNGEGFRPKDWGKHTNPCVVCGVITKNKYCSSDCRSVGTTRFSYDIIKSMSFKDALGVNSAKYRKVRDYAKQLYNKGKDGVCQATGYTKHTEVCHIIPLSQFQETTPIGVMNDRRNILILSPNAHWEFDHQLFTLADIDPEIEKSFNVFKQECIDAGWLK